MIDLAALRALIAVQDHGSVVAAADQLGFTPSAVSQQIKKLERQSRGPMLERVGRSVILTDRGRLLATRGAQLLADLEQVENLALADAEELHGVVRIASFSSGHRGLVAPLLARLRSTAPDLDVVVTEMDPRETVTLVERGGADIALVHDWDTVPVHVPRALERSPLTIDRVDVLLHRDHPLVAQVGERGEVDTTQLFDERWVSTHPGSICHEWLLQMFAFHGTVPDIRFHDADYSSHAALVAHGVAAALMPRLGRVLLPPEVAVLPVVNPTPRRNVSTVWRSSSTDNPARRHVQQQLEALVAGQRTDGVERDVRTTAT